MKNHLPINRNGIVIPEHEIEITTSRAGGPGGQYVNRTSSRVTVRWNVKNTQVLNDVQKERVLTRLASKLTNDGDLIIHNSSTRSQHQNRDLALTHLIDEVRKALFVPKKRKKTHVPKSVQEARLKTKKQRGAIKKERSVKYFD